MKLLKFAVIALLGSCVVFLLTQHFIGNQAFISTARYQGTYSRGIYANQNSGSFNYPFLSMQTNPGIHCMAISLSPTGATVQGWPFPYNFSVQHACIANSVRVVIPLLFDMLLDLIVVSLIVGFLVQRRILR